MSLNFVNGNYFLKIISPVYVLKSYQGEVAILIVKKHVTGVTTTESFSQP